MDEEIEKTESLETTETREIEPVNEPNENSLIETLKNEYEAKIKNIIDKKNTEIAKRDKVISELINDSDTPKISKPDIEVYIDKINEERLKQFKY